MDKQDTCDPYSRPARRTQWIVSTLSYHYGLDRGVENEIIVLATGLDQYLQEIFHHLDCQGEGKIPAEDFKILCEVLGLDNETDQEECAGMLENIPKEFTFRQFHAKLCGYFSTKAGCQYENGRLLVGKESEHIETQIRLRSPLRRRENTLSVSEEAEDRIVKLEDENTSLRELVEDMRAALQSSDARSLALQVGLWKSHSKHKAEELAKELRRSQEALLTLEDCNRTLKHEQAEMRKKVEDARQAVLSSLGKVKELEAKANHMPLLQRHILQLESELIYYRSEVSKLQILPSSPQEQRHSAAALQASRCYINTQSDRRSPTGHAEPPPDNTEEQLFRSVEGQAASDEEEEKWTGEQQSQVDEVKRILTRLSCCGDRCDDKTVKKLLSHFGGSKNEESRSAVVELLEKVTKLTKQLELKESQAKELQQKAEETELLQMELQMLETERVRLSLVEEKLMDVLQLLQQLRDLNVSRRSLGKILLSTLESCSDPQHGKAHILEVLNALYHELAACELLSSTPLEGTSSHTSLANPLLISC
uniref:EF-hand and coiled-coil domain containing 1 n=1 Tax=Lepisosteus oculatus TaxID=7918 RepID=W5N9G7_LEPOC